MRQGLADNRVDAGKASESDHNRGESGTGVIDSDWLAEALSWIVPVAIFVGIWMFFIRRLAAPRS